MVHRDCSGGEGILGQPGYVERAPAKFTNAATEPGKSSLGLEMLVNVLGLKVKSQLRGQPETQA